MSALRWFSEINHILRLGIPLIIAHIAMIGMEIIDTMMAGQVSGQDLAGLAVGGNVWLIAEVAMGGLLTALTPRIARFRGAGESQEITHEMQQGLLLSLFIGVLMMLIMLALVPLIPILGTEDAVTVIAQDYTRIIAYSLPASAICWAIYCLIEAHALMRFIVITSLAALGLNAVFDYLFVFGKLGFPAMGGAGCAVTTTAIYWLWAVACIGFIQKNTTLKNLGIFASWPRLDWQRWRAILALGIPISLALLAEESFFSISALLIAPLGTNPLGAHQITLQIVAVVLMLSLGAGQATAIRVANSIGANRPEQVRFHIKAGLAIVLTAGLVLGVVIFIFRDSVPMLFTQDATIIAISSAIMLLAPLYLIYDALQIWAAQTLRGFEDTKVPMICQIVAYWLIGFPLGYSLATTTFWGKAYGIYGFWGGFLAGIIIAGFLLTGRLLSKTREMAKV